MLINLSPVRDDRELSVSVQADVLTVNGVPFDFSPLEEGDSIPAGAVNSPWFLGDISRTAGKICVTMVLPHGPFATDAARFPKAISVDSDGPVSLPDPGHTNPDTPASLPEIPEEPSPPEESSTVSTFQPVTPEDAVPPGAVSPEPGTLEEDAHE